MKLFEIYKPTLLLEYKRDITAKKLGVQLLAIAKTNGENYSLDQILEIIENIDPTRNKQYVLWLCNQYLKRQFRLEDYPRIHETLTHFEQVKSRLPIKDINQYTFHSLEDAMDKAFNVELKKDNVSTDTNNTFPVVPNSLILSKYRRL